MKSDTKMALVGAAVGFGIATTVELIRLSLGQRDLGQDLGWMIATVLFFTALGSAMWWGAFRGRVGLFARRKPDAELESSDQDSVPDRT
ncbi:MAG: hypothetical protein ACTHZ5_08585 [Micrococcaceae bacterium]